MPNWIFVWTLNDILGVIIFGLIILFFAGCFALLGIDNLWFKITGKHLPYNRPRKNGVSK